MKSVHKGDTFPCLHCNYKATRKDKLNFHIKSVHEGQKFSCPHCEYKATTKGSLKVHIKSVHESITHQCPHCKFNTAWKGNIQKHIKSVHKGITHQWPHCKFKSIYKEKKIEYLSLLCFPTLSHLVSVKRISITKSDITKKLIWTSSKKTVIQFVDGIKLRR